MSRAPLQRSLGRLPEKKEINDQFHRNIRLADASKEDYSVNCAKDALMIYGRILPVPSLAQIIVEQEKRDGHNSLWNNIGKLVVLATKTADQDERQWAMDSLEDYQINHIYLSGDLPKHLLQGDESRGHHSLVDIQVQGSSALGDLFIHCFGVVPARCGSPAREDQVTRPLIGLYRG